MRVSTAARTVRVRRMARSDAMTARYEMASAPKHHPSPSVAMRMPPIDGPMMREALIIDEFSAMAFGRSSRSSTISTTNACRAGVSNELITPCTSCSAITSATVMTFINASTASAADCNADRICVMTRMRCRSHRSTSTPANGERISIGICPANPTMPSSSSDPVRR